MTIFKITIAAPKARCGGSSGDQDGKAGCSKWQEALCGPMVQVKD